MSDQQQTRASPGGGFAKALSRRTGFASAIWRPGQGPPLVHLHGAGGMRLTRGHDLLAGITG